MGQACVRRLGLDGIDQSQQCIDGIALGAVLGRRV